MTDEQVKKLCRFLEIVIEEPGAGFEKTGAHPTTSGYTFRAGNAKLGKKSGKSFQSIDEIIYPYKSFAKTLGKEVSQKLSPTDKLYRQDAYSTSKPKKLDREVLTEHRLIQYPVIRIMKSQTGMKL